MNDNAKPKDKGDLVINALVITAASLIPGGMFLAWYLDQGWPLIVTAVAFIFFMAG